MNFEKIITKHVQKLVPYLSARRIGGHGHNFLNANESPKSEGYFLNSSTLVWFQQNGTMFLLYCQRLVHEYPKFVD